MNIVLLCGGLGTRLSEETDLVPKPMIKIGEAPILQHIMNYYSHFNFNQFYLALGFKAAVVKDYFLNFYALNNDLKVNLHNGKVEYLKESHKNWEVNLIDTGAKSMTGGRILRLKKYLAKEPFMVTYGDGLTDLDLRKLLAFHKSHGKIATFTAVRPPSRFGVIEFEGNQVNSFKEKPQNADGWINGGFFVFNPEIFDYLEDDQTILERSPLERLASDGQLMGYKHEGFWQCMDTMRDKNFLNQIWESGEAPWTESMLRKQYGI